MIEAVIGQGKVIGGAYVNSPITSGMRGDLVVGAGFKRRKLIASEVTLWVEVTTSGSATTDPGMVGKVGRFMAGSVLPGAVGKVAGMAIDATLASSNGQLPSVMKVRTLRIDWVDGKQSLIRLPEKMFTHFNMVLADRQDRDAPGAQVPPEAAAVPVQASTSTAPQSPPSPQPNVMEQITQLAALRDQGILTEEEFSAKKTELLERL